MKTKLSPLHPALAMLRRTKLLSLVFGLLSFIFYPLSSQVPQGFNYQAIARDAGGSLITTAFDIKVEIQNLAADTVFWIEEHTVTPNEYGLISFIVGQSGRIGGTALVFDDIDWASHPRYLKTSANTGSGYTEMGIAQIMSVPYSLVAREVTGPVENLNIIGTTEDMDEALFEVRNKDGQVIFAVYNEGVRIYVDDEAKGPKGGFAIGSFGINKEGESQPLFIVKPDTVRIYINQTGKGPKGGFAIGGYGIDKTDPQNFLFVSDDSVRIYIDNADDDYPKGVKGGFAIGGYGLTKGGQKLMTVSDDSVRIYIDDGSKGPKGGFAIGGFDKTKGEGNNANFFNVSTSAQDTIDPSQNRILWYPVKNAFLTGKVLVELPDSVGENSFASGYESKAIGRYSQALGYQAIARGDYSTAIGKSAVANKINSFAFGDSARAQNVQTYAFGYQTLASGLGSLSLGYRAKTTGQDAFAFGSGTEAIGQGSFAIGFIGRDSAGMATGNTKAEEDWAVAIGMGAQAKKTGSFSFGTQTISDGEFAFASGYKTTSSGFYSTSMGAHTTASGQGSTSMGMYSVASGNSSIAGGYFSRATGECSTAMGYSIASGYCSTAMGSFSKASGQSSTAIGNFNKATYTGSAAFGSVTESHGYCSTSMGYYTIARPCNSLVIGMYNDTTWSADCAIYPNLEDPIFIVGNGYGIHQRSNALTVLKNGCIGLNLVVSPTYALELPNHWSQIRGTGIAYAWTTYSDSRVKEYQNSLVYGLKEIMALLPKQYIHHNSTDRSTWLNDNAPRSIGLVAQDVYNVIPEAVNKPEDEDKALWSMSYDKLIPVMVKAIQEQQHQIESQQQQIDTQNQKIDQLIVLIDELKKEIASSSR